MKHSFFLTSALLFAFACSSPPPPKPAAVSVRVIKPKMADTPIYLEYPGHVEAYKTVNVKAQVSGDLTGMYFEEGASVKAGDLLFTIDSRPYRAALAKAEAALASSIAALKLSSDTVKRYTPLAKESYVAQLSYDQYLTDAIESDATVKANKASVDAAEINLSYCSFYAPMDAIAGKKEFDVGNFIQVGEQTPLIVLNQIDPVFAAFYIPDVDLRIIQKHQKETGPLKTEVYLNGNREEVFEGTLTLIDNQVDQATGSLYMKATLPNPEKILWPGEFVSVRVILETRKNAILLPSQAIQLGQNGYFAFVVDKENKAELRLLQIGERHGEYVRIVQGISETDTVVLEGQINLTSGTEVTIIQGENKSSVKIAPNISTALPRVSAGKNR